MSVTERPVVTTVEDGIATITLNSPGTFNAMSLAWGAALQEDVEALAARDDVHVVLLRAVGKAFCVGGDVSLFAEADDPYAVLHGLASGLHASMLGIQALGVPVVAAVQGVAAGAGLSLVCAADIAIAGQSASFTSAYTAVGLSPDGGQSWLLPRLVGTRRATEMMLTNRLVLAEEAATIGLITEVVADDELDARALKVAQRLAKGSKASFDATKRLLRSAATNTFEAQLVLEADSIATLAASPSGKEGVAAFIEKRKPNFQD